MKTTALANQSRQQKYLEQFIMRYTERTKTSKQLAQTYRPYLADERGTEDFSFPFKEMTYPIASKRAAGSRMWDVDGNEYIDLVMGLGVNLFGYNPPFIQAALAEQLEQGIQLGSQLEFVGEVAELFCELTRMERVAFSNTGTEAIMTAIRLARSVTGRNKVAIFSHSYHGHSDQTLVQAETVDENLHSVPIYPGIPPSAAEDVLVLDFMHPRSLDAIAARHQELAAVLVSPIQRQRPDRDPRMFLHQLRQLTAELGIALIFDEVVTGFRLHPGGAQAFFDVAADLAVYGKIVGGGMPIGAVAGKAVYMDRIDGGMWNYGDASYPQANQTLFAGTFRKHPLAIAAARAVLQYLKLQGSTLQEQLAQRTSQFIAELNAYFATKAVPLRMANFSSIIGPATSGISASFESLMLLNYNLIDRGVLLLPGGGGYLSATHTDEDIVRIVQVFKDSVEELQNVGLLLQ
ncbi:aspartate aminotransferase family protein [Chroococcidiopsis sp. CCALA 051]|uniref:aspartate aminotransferase family protein n=1 Tax=Chroococcidiopsis sp. CCALA 051 TaxID=869949 RepID=UPI000D0D2ADE|nr:aminotransferase class III-fold pyridoxal phosphate-dependent enzyme [Chroococcidiopsis sp. CCALA 051]PSM49388.1 aspartate aminotransferase family protein [Chroococcidiopsis sp. CCALA 051]